jgi:hypothetical protein
VRWQGLTCLQIKDAVGNEYGKPKDVAGEQRMVFTSHADAAFDVCFENLLVGGTSRPSPHAPVRLVHPLISLNRQDSNDTN